MTGLTAFGVGIAEARREASVSWVESNNGLPEGYTPPSASLSPTDTAYADAVARREMERDLAWAEHLRDALLIIEEDDDE